MMRRIKIGSRASQLAITQSEMIIKALRDIFPQYDYEIIKIQTQGDKILDKTLDKIGGKGLFVKEIQNALLEGSIDMAVHSMKDMPGQSPQGLILAAMTIREDARDVLATKDNIPFENLRQGAVIGSSSLRRQAQILNLRPDLRIEPIRGNVGTRLKKIETQSLDGIILAAAGLIRLNLQDRISYYFEPDIFVPAVGQGALGCEIRSNDEELYDMLSKINHLETYGCVMAERVFLSELEGGCHVPIGAYATKVDDNINILGMVAAPDGSKIVRASQGGLFKDYEAAGITLGKRMIDMGVKELLDECLIAN